MADSSKEIRARAALRLEKTQRDAAARDKARADHDAQRSQARERMVEQRRQRLAKEAADTPASSSAEPKSTARRKGGTESAR
ncbi:MAG: hypothetical protein U1E56_01750 [Bauldia sp.]